MITNSELRSIDLNVLGECYIPSSDIFSDNKETEKNEGEAENEEIDIKQEVQEGNYDRLGTRNLDIANRRGKDGEKIHSFDSQKIDSMLRKSIDNFIYETKDILKPSGGNIGSIQKNNFEKVENKHEFEQNSKHYIAQNNLPRSASQKYNYQRPPITDTETRFVPVSPMNSAVKRVIHRKRHQLHPTPPHAQNAFQRNRIDNYQYSSLLHQPQSTSGDGYYVQNSDNVKQIRHYSFNAPRKSTHSSEGYLGQQQEVYYPGTHHASYDENFLPPDSQRQISYVNGPAIAPSHSSGFKNYPEEKEYFNSQKQRVCPSKSPIISSSKGGISMDKAQISNPKKGHYTENHSLDMEYEQSSNIYTKIHNKRQSNQTIQEEQESKTSREDTKIEDSLQKSTVENIKEQNEEGFIGDDTVHTTNHGGSGIQHQQEYKSLQKPPSKTRHFDSFSNKLVDFSKEESPEPKNNQMTFLCLNLYEILNRNKIPVKQNPEDSSQDMVIKIFESVAHELRLKKDRIENLENVDIEKTKKWDKLKDHNDNLMKAHQKLERRYEEQEKDYEQVIKNQEQNFKNLRDTAESEKEQLKREIIRLRNKNRKLDSD